MESAAFPLVPSQTLVVMMTMMLLISTTNKCRASDLVVRSSSNETSSNETGSIIAYQDDLEMEFQMDSEINKRLLASGGGYNTGPTGNPNQPAACGRGRYRPCSGPTTDGNTNYCKNVYNRDCK